MPGLARTGSSVQCQTTTLETIGKGLSEVGYEQCDSDPGEGRKQLTTLLPLKHYALSLSPLPLDRHLENTITFQL